jgi:hypothetical protein
MPKYLLTYGSIAAACFIFAAVVHSDHGLAEIKLRDRVILDKPTGLLP